MSALFDFAEKVKKFRCATEALNLVDLTWHLERAASMEQAILEADPIKPGSLVEMIKTIEVSESHNWGWLSAKEHLKVGGLWRVYDVEVNGDGRCRYGCLPEAWSHHPDKSLYFHSRNYVRLINAEKKEPINEAGVLEMLQNADANFQLYTMRWKNGCDMPRTQMAPCLETAWDSIKTALKHFKTEDKCCRHCRRKGE